MIELPNITWRFQDLRETLNDDTEKFWVLSTNTPHHIPMISWGILGCLLIFTGLHNYFIGPNFPVFLYSALTTVHLTVGIGGFFIIYAIFLFYDSKSIHNTPFPKTSTCMNHPHEPAYDWCALCGILACPQDLVRIKQKFAGISPGMFGFDGVACQNCAQRRVKRFFLVFVSLLFLIFSLMLVNVVNLIMLGPFSLTGICLLSFIGTIIGLGSLFGWLYWKIWLMVNTPLSEHDELIISITSRLAEK